MTSPVLLLVAASTAALSAAAIVKQGDPAYRTSLVGISPAEGVLSPAFEPHSQRRDYRIEAANAQVKAVHIDLLLDFSVYHPWACPQITMDGKVIEYTPMDGARVVVPVAGVGAVERQVFIKVSDPKSAPSGWGDFVQRKAENAHEYVLTIAKPPATNALTSVESIHVQDAVTGKELSGEHPFHPQAQEGEGSFSYVAPDSTKRLAVRARCPREHGVALLVDGEPVEEHGVKYVDVANVYQKRIVVRCEYSDATWSPQAVFHTYVLDISKHMARRSAEVVSAQLMPLPAFGGCESVHQDDAMVKAHHFSVNKSFGELVSPTAFVCRADRDRALFVATFSTTDGAVPKATLTNTETGAGTDMPNAMPTEVVMAKERQYFVLKVAAGDLSVVYPVVMLWPGNCNTLSCPQEQMLKPQDPYDAKAHMCASEVCSAVADAEQCCVARPSCGSFDAGCPAGQALREDAASVLCAGSSCTKEADQATCCGAATLTSTSTLPATTSTTTVLATTTTKPSTTSATASTSSSASARSSTGRPTSTARPSSTASTATAAATVATTVTETTTRLYCIEPNAVWLPLDMPGHGPVVLESRDACQERCRSTEGCATFAFWVREGHCHLQSSSATKQMFGYGFDSGPAECTIRHTVTQTTTNPIPSNQRCFQHGIVWSPLLGSSVQLEASREKTARPFCQQYCAETDGCARFQYDSFTGLCNLAGASAEPLRGPSAVVSGPPVCDTIYGELADLIAGSDYSSPASGAAASDAGSGSDATAFAAAKRFFGGSRQGGSRGQSLSCVTEGVFWVPFIKSLPAPRGRRGNAISECQAACAAEPRCHRFTVSFVDQTCRLSEADAMHLSGVGVASGPPQCQDSAAYGDLAILRRFRAGRSAPRPSGAGAGIARAWAVAAAVAAGCALLAFAAVVAAAARRRGGGAGEAGRRALFLAAGDDDEDMVE